MLDSKHIVARVLLLLVSFVVASSALAVRYVPYAGRDGYRELRLDPDLYFVAIFGTLADDANDLSAAFNARAAQLCDGAGYAHFVELAYAIEPVLKGDPPVIALHDRGARAIRAGGAVYIPIFIPQGGANVDLPVKQAHVRCVKDPASVLEPRRLMDAQKLLGDAKKKGWVK